MGGRGKGLEFGFEIRLELYLMCFPCIVAYVRCLRMCVFFKVPLEYKIDHLNGFNLQYVTFVSLIRTAGPIPFHQLFTAALSSLRTF